MYSVSGTDLGAVPWTDQSADSFGRLLPPADSGGIRDQSGGKSRSTGEVDGLYLSSDGNVGIQFADLLDTFAISCE